MKYVLTKYVFCDIIYIVKAVRRLTFKELERIIKADGWKYQYTRGSHFYYTHSSKSGKVTIPNHKGDIPKGTANSILKQAGLK